ncbi:MAG: FKBP-type peptidyl-prolyl cis-trans isomerase [Verrucomicrobiales bacterium]|nr:FKBP-type peptidyl-prolyl cis-trans isomerase [Verrucomicrobiales bacterium]
MKHRLLLFLFSAVGLVAFSSCVSNNNQPANAGTTATTGNGPTAADTAAPSPLPAVGTKATTQTGLQYEVLRSGNGRRPKSFEKVKVHYHGTLLDGTVFDSSVQRGEPITFALNQVIPGWTEGLQLMPIGSKFRFTIPHYLAYGVEGKPPTIGPRETLMFEVELLDIVR